MRYGLEKPEPLHLLNGNPTHCHWCTGLLKGLRDIYKGQNCERCYCSQKCLKDGEERAAQYAKRPVSPRRATRSLPSIWREPPPPALLDWELQSKPSASQVSAAFAPAVWSVGTDRRHGSRPAKSLL